MIPGKDARMTKTCTCITALMFIIHNMGMWVWVLALFSWKVLTWCAYQENILLNFFIHSCFYSLTLINTLVRNRLKLTMTTFNQQCQRASAILSSYEKVVEEKILPKKKIRIEMTYDLRNEISHIKSYLLRARNTPESILKIELRLNRLRLDVWRAGNLSGIDITDDIPESYLEICL